MQVDGVLFTNTVLYSMGFLLIGLIIIRVKAIPLRSFQSVYLLLGASNIAVHYFTKPEVDALFLIANLAVGIFVLLLATGIFGKLESSHRYETLLISIGLFPWYLNLLSSMVYIVAAFLFCSLAQLLSSIAALKSMHYPLKTLTRVSAALPADKLAVYRSKADVIMTTPVGLAALFAVLLYSISF